MKVPNPFYILWRVLSWPFGVALGFAARSIRFQAWLLKRMHEWGAPTEKLNQIARAFNELNYRRSGFILPDGRFRVPDAKAAVEKSQAEQAEKQSEAKP
jgi:hypothetical protein